MPLVYITMLEGRPQHKIDTMIALVSQAIADSLDADINSVRIMITEMTEGQYGVGGKPWSVVKAERAAAAKVADDAARGAQA